MIVQYEMVNRKKGDVFQAITIYSNKFVDGDGDK